MPKTSNLVSQSNFSGGLNALIQFAQQRGKAIVTRISNLVFTIRGALRTVDGCQTIVTFPANTVSNLDPLIPAIGPMYDIQCYSSPQSGGNGTTLIALYDSALTPPTFSLTPVTDGAGTLAPGTYQYTLTGEDQNLLQTDGVVHSVAVAGPNNAVDITWSLGAAFQVAIYGRISGLQGFLLDSTDPLVTGATFRDLGTIVPQGAPPTTNSARSMILGYSTKDIFSTSTGIRHKFPGAYIIKMVPPQGASGGGTTSLTTLSLTFTPCGGAPLALRNSPGTTCPLPQMIPFAGIFFLALGNDYTPYIFDPVANTTTALSNTFAASYPVWIAGQNYIVGSVVTPTVANGHRFVCAQAGTSGVAEPTWQTGDQQPTADGSIIWAENGTDSTSPTPFGAAHAAVFNGSLWIANTKYQNSVDGLDGPSSLRMSDVRLPSSYDPLNQVFVSKDDGQEIMGLASFSVADAGINPVGTLVIFKNFSTYTAQGSMGDPSFSLQKAKTDLGCIAPRSIQFVPGIGIMRMTNLGIAAYDGTNDDVFLDDPVHPYIFDGTVDDISGIDWDYVYFCKATRSNDPPFYVLGVPVKGDQSNTQRGIIKRWLCFDTQLKIWTVVDLPFGISALFQARLYGTEPLTLSGDYSGGKLRRFFASDTDFEQSGPVEWSFRPEEVFGNQASQRVYVQQVLLRCLGTGVPTQAEFLVNGTIAQDPNSNPVPLTVTLLNSPVAVGTRFESTGQINTTVLNITANFSGTGQIEIDSIDWDVKPKAIGVPVTIG